MQQLEEAHLKTAKRILRYLKKTLNYRLHFPSSGDAKLHFYADVGWGSDIDTRRSTLGVLHKLDGATIDWKTKLQPSISLSTTEVEYRVLTDAT
jgi:hypothetical protein